MYAGRGTTAKRSGSALSVIINEIILVILNLPAAVLNLNYT